MGVEEMEEQENDEEEEEEENHDDDELRDSQDEQQAEARSEKLGLCIENLELTQHNNTVNIARLWSQLVRAFIKSPKLHHDDDDDDDQRQAVQPFAI